MSSIINQLTSCVQSNKHRKNIVLFIIIVLVFIANTVFIYQPNYNHLVIGSRIPDIRFVFYDGELNSVWLSDKVFTTESVDNVSTNL